MIVGEEQEAPRAGGRETSTGRRALSRSSVDALGIDEPAPTDGPGREIACVDQCPDPARMNAESRRSLRNGKSRLLNHIAKAIDEQPR